MDIGYIVPRYAPFSGGVETHVREIATRIAGLGHRVEVLTQEPSRSLPAMETVSGLMVRRFHPIAPEPIYAVAPNLWMYLRQNAARFDILHVHSYHALPGLGALATRTPPVVFTPHYHRTGHTALGRFLHPAYRRLLGNRLFARAGAVICVSEVEAAWVRHDFPGVAGWVRVIPNGVDAAAIGQAEPLNMGQTVVLTVGRLVPYKNVARLIEVMARLEDGPMLAVIGEGPERPALEALTAHMGLQGRVRFLGRVDDPTLYRWLRTAQVVASLSEQEAFGLTVLEGAAAGARVLASDIPAHQEIAAGVGRDRIDLIASSSDGGEVARRLRHLIHAPRSPVAIPERYTWDAIARETLEVYESTARSADRSK